MAEPADQRRMILLLASHSLASPKHHRDLGRRNSNDLNTSVSGEAQGGDFSKTKPIKIMMAIMTMITIIQLSKPSAADGPEVDMKDDSRRGQNAGCWAAQTRVLPRHGCRARGAATAAAQCRPWPRGPQAAAGGSPYRANGTSKQTGKTRKDRNSHWTYFFFSVDFLTRSRALTGAWRREQASMSLWFLCYVFLHMCIAGLL